MSRHDFTSERIYIERQRGPSPATKTIYPVGLTFLGRAPRRAAGACLHSAFGLLRRGRAEGRWLALVASGVVPPKILRSDLARIIRVLVP